MKKNLTLAQVQNAMSYIMWVTDGNPWTMQDEVEWMKTARHPTIKASVSRNKREGQYAGYSTIHHKHHRIYHHKKPVGFKAVGYSLLLAIF